jgi:intein/homing endonuclease
MNETRIKIGDVWYVREDLLEPKKVEIDPTNYLGCASEDDDFAFDAHVLLKDGAVLEDTIYLKVTDKRTEPWVDEHWDNSGFLQDTLDGDLDILTDLKNESKMSRESIEHLREFLKILKGKGWF